MPGVQQVREALCQVQQRNSAAAAKTQQTHQVAAQGGEQGDMIHRGLLDRWAKVMGFQHLAIARSHTRGLGITLNYNAVQ